MITIFCYDSFESLAIIKINNITEFLNYHYILNFLDFQYKFFSYNFFITIQHLPEFLFQSETSILYFYCPLWVCVCMCVCARVRVLKIHGERLHLATSLLMYTVSKLCYFCVQMCVWDRENLCIHCACNSLNNRVCVICEHVVVVGWNVSRFMCRFCCIWKQIIDELLANNTNNTIFFLTYATLIVLIVS